MVKTLHYPEYLSELHHRGPVWVCNGFCVCVVPPPVSNLRRVAASETSLSLEWNVPVLQNQHQILEYQLRYSAKVHSHNPTHLHRADLIGCASATDVMVCQDGEDAGQWQYVSSRSSSVVLSGLQRALQYQVQVRARSQAGYGSFSTASVFNTLPDGTTACLTDWLPV